MSISVAFGIWFRNAHVCRVASALPLVPVADFIDHDAFAPMPSASACFPTKRSSQPVAPESCCPVESPGDLYKLLISGFHADVTGMECDLGIRSFKSPGWF